MCNRCHMYRTQLQNNHYVAAMFWIIRYGDVHESRSTVYGSDVFCVLLIQKVVQSTEPEAVKAPGLFSLHSYNVKIYSIFVKVCLLLNCII